MHHAPVHEIVLDEISVRFYPQKRIEIHYPKEFEITMETARQMDKHILKMLGQNRFDYSSISRILLEICLKMFNGILRKKLRAFPKLKSQPLS